MNWQVEESKDGVNWSVWHVADDLPGKWPTKKLALQWAWIMSCNTTNGTWYRVV